MSLTKSHFIPFWFVRGRWFDFFLEPCILVIDSVSFCRVTLHHGGD
jgi:hypothetical protein